MLVVELAMLNVSLGFRLVLLISILGSAKVLKLNVSLSVRLPSLT